MNPLGLQVSKFATVGVINTIIDVVLFNLIRKFTKTKTILASYISSTIGMINSYVMNKYWTFESTQSGLSAAGEAAKFFGSTIIGVYVIHNGLVWLLSEKIKWPYKLVYSITKKLPILKKLSEKFVCDNTAKLFGIAGSLIWNFLLYKFWVFK